MENPENDTHPILVDFKIMTTTRTRQAIEKFQQDRFAMYVGIEILEAAQGYAKVKLDIKEHHYNALGIVQGGVLFTLADFALAVAGNTGEETTVSVEANISYMKPGRSGSIFAEARELSRSKSLIGYEVPIVNEQGELLARFYGRAFVRK